MGKIDQLKMKELNINGKIFAKYEIEGGLLYLKTIIKVFKENETHSEHFIILLIQSLEDVEFKAVAYLNV